jgi:hypothetical protein
MPCEVNVGDAIRDATQNSTDGTTYWAHCISACRAMGAGFAKQILREVCIERPEGVDIKVPSILKQVVTDASKLKPTDALAKSKVVFHLVTKRRYFDKPVLSDFISTIELLEESLPVGTIINAPKLGCGLDRLSWKTVYARLVASTLTWKVWELPTSRFK